MFQRWIEIPSRSSCLIIGSRRSGKTTLLKHRYPDWPYATLDDLDYLDWAKRDPKGLISHLGDKAVIDEKDFVQIQQEEMQLGSVNLPVQASHFVHHLYHSTTLQVLRTKACLRTTLDSSLQHKVQRLLDQRLRDLGNRAVRNGAVLVVDHEKREVLAWVNGGNRS